MIHRPVNLSVLIGEHLAKNRRLKWATRYHRQRAWRLLIEATGDMDISEFAYSDAEDFVEYLYSKDLEVNSIRSYIKTVRPVFRWAWRRGYREGDPFDGLKLPKSPKYEIRVYSEAELRDMLASAPNDMWQARIMTANTAGLRKGEILNLTVKDVNFEEDYISVQAKKNTSETWPWTPKSYEVRRVPLTDELANLYSQILAELPPGYPYLMLTEQRYWWLQRLRRQGEMTERMMLNPDENFSKPFQKILRTAEISDGCFHDLRRTAITRWSNNLPPQDTQALAGHADIKTTLTYYSAVSSNLLERARSLGATGLEPATS
ncbi:MAG: tyrosine-type recombinase/integrase [Phycisphaerae bacterium]|nr:tyrosine-type recombinase/integrase [Phycisphaerae bacterium]NIS22540.1 tyrosine-type recombinase/integrase [candidate division KSB1 bacterium]NIP55113.1 tyrosine-type recombinase/integrase [Phycisphaerae bacterium]NIS49735.1 tyrosine-type recombinase/integrase [Phycisphaerae bacterium]NIU28767.1 tyrosine-type recombinase/integrase [candidate division KSB1 bacterium]